MSPRCIQAARLARDLDECKVLVALVSVDCTEFLVVGAPDGVGGFEGSALGVVLVCRPSLPWLYDVVGLPRGRIHTVLDRLVDDGRAELSFEGDAEVYRIRLDPPTSRHRGPPIAAPAPEPASEPPAPGATLPLRLARALLARFAR